MIRNIVVFICLLGGIACGNSGGGPTGPTGPTTGSSSLAVRVQGQIGNEVRPIASTVRLLDGGNQQVATQNVSEGQVAEFRNLANADYKVWGEGFGFAQTQTMTSVNGNIATELTLPATFAARLISITADGREIKSGDTVQYPTHLELRMEFMNPTTDMWRVSGKLFQNSQFNVISPPIVVSGFQSQGLHTVTANLVAGQRPDYQPCNYTPVLGTGTGSYTDQCLASSDRLILLFSNSNSQGVAPPQVNIDFTIKWVKR